MDAGRRAAGDLRPCNGPCRNSRVTAGPPRSSGPPTTSSTSSSTSTRPATPPGAASDGRSVWIEPTAPRFTSEAVLAQEEAILTWAMAAQADPPAPSTTVDRDGLDPLQADAAAAVAGDDRLVLVVGPAGAGKTRMLTAAADDLRRARPGRVRGGADREGGPDGRARHRHPGRHGRQAAPRVAAHRPATAARVPAAGRRDADRRRGRHAVDPRPPPARHPRRPEPVAAGARRRPPPAARRRPRRPVRRAVRQRPRRRARTPPPLHPPLGSRRVPAAATPATPRRSTPTKPTAASSPAPSTTTSTGIAATWIDHHDDGPQPRRRRLDQRPRRRHQPAPSRPPGSTPATSTRPMATRIAGGETAHVGDVVATRRNDRRLVTSHR